MIRLPTLPHPQPIIRAVRALLILIVCVGLLAGCSPASLTLQALPQNLRQTVRALEQAAPAATNALPASEARVQVLRLAGPAANRRAEISGMAWFEETLILLPQWPDFQQDGSNVLFALPRAQIEEVVEGRSRAPLEPLPIRLDDGAVRAALPTFGGYESIAFVGERAFLTIESWAPVGSDGYLVWGSVDRDNATITLDPATLTLIPPQTAKPNVSDEAIVVAGDTLLTIYELNGPLVNDAPISHRFTLEGAPIEPAAFPPIEYRITDATPVDENGRFWAINFYFPAEGIAVVDEEPLAATWGEGPTHAGRTQVERLVQFEWDGTQVRLVDRAPIQLRLSLLPRNWEGIARLGDDGFLLVTDKYPTTVLAYVEAPE